MDVIAWLGIRAILWAMFFLLLWCMPEYLRRRRKQRIEAAHRQVHRE